MTTMQREPGPFETGDSSTPAPEPRHPRADRAAQELAREAALAGDWPPDRSVPVSALVPVKNEASNIVACLRRLQWADEIVVVDSQSTDDTVPLAQALGAKVFQFYISAEGWPKKRNWALGALPWSNEWVLVVDADEHATPELAREVAATVAPSAAGDRSDAREAYWINRRFMFLGRWIRHCGYYPSYNIRLFKHRIARYERIGSTTETESGDNEIHEQIVLSRGEAGYLGGELLHYAYPDLSTWIAKHDRYAAWEACAMDSDYAGELRASLFGKREERIRWLKWASRKTPMRPTLRFLYSYVLRFGFLDGYPGYALCRLLAWYEFLSTAKRYERRVKDAAAQRQPGDS